MHRDAEPGVSCGRTRDASGLNCCTAPRRSRARARARARYAACTSGCRNATGRFLGRESLKTVVSVFTRVATADYSERRGADCAHSFLSLVILSRIVLFCTHWVQSYRFSVDCARHTACVTFLIDANGTSKAVKMSQLFGRRVASSHRTFNAVARRA